MFPRRRVRLPRLARNSNPWNLNPGWNDRPPWADNAPRPSSTFSLPSSHSVVSSPITSRQGSRQASPSPPVNRLRGEHNRGGQFPFIPPPDVRLLTETTGRGSRPASASPSVTSASSDTASDGRPANMTYRRAGERRLPVNGGAREDPTQAYLATKQALIPTHSDSLTHCLAIEELTWIDFVSEVEPDHDRMATFYKPLDRLLRNIKRLDCQKDSVFREPVMDSSTLAKVLNKFFSRNRSTLEFAFAHLPSEHAALRTTASMLSNYLRFKAHASASNAFSQLLQQSSSYLHRVVRELQDIQRQVATRPLNVTT